MTMFGSQWLANAGGAGYEIDQSIRFSDNDSARLARTVSSSGSLTTWTLSGWIKRGRYTSSVNNQWFPVYTASAGSTAYDAPLNFNDAAAGGSFDVYIAGQEWRTTALARDTSAWYHVVIVWDTTNGTASDRMRLYVNGERQTDFSITGSVSSGANSQWNSSSYSHHRIGNLNYNGGETTYVFDGYLAEINFIDGTALDPTSFGEYNDDGVWVPIEYTNAAGYGTNGFYITGETASDLGEDFSGNSNDFTSSGLTTADQMLDTPTDNFCTWNPLKTNSSATLSDGNLNYTASGAQRTTSTFAVNSGKWYAEFTISAATGSQTWGVVDITQVSLTDAYIGQRSYEWGIDGLARTWNNGSNAANYTDFSASDVIGIALDMDNGKVWFRDNDGTFLSGGDPAAGTTPDFSGLSGDICFAAQFTGGNVTINCGQSAYTNAPPTGFNALSTANLATPSIKDGSAYFQPTLYTGNNGTQAIVNSGNSDLAPDLVWIKSRTTTRNHILTDAVRGVTKSVSSNTASAEATDADNLTAFGSDGFTVGDDTSFSPDVNASGVNYVAWQWAANGAGSSNTDGTISSTVSADTTSGFSIVSYVGNSTSGATVGHGLGAVPKMMILKDRDVAENWCIYHEELGPTKFLYFTTAAAFTASNRWNDTAPTSSVFTLGNETQVNATGRDYVVYCFAEIPGYNSIGSYTGNGSTDGPFVYTGFKPAFVMFKVSTNAPTGWAIIDNKRSNPFNPTDGLLQPDQSGVESTSDKWDILSNGFKVRTTWPAVNGNGYTVTYMAFAENPFGGDGVAPATAR